MGIVKRYELEDCLAEREREVTISIDEYRDLLDIQTRASILRMKLVEAMESELEIYKKNHNSCFSVRSANVNVAQICNIMAFTATLKGYIEKEQKAIESYEYEKMVEREG
jgi:hypothetical protein